MKFNWLKTPKTFFMLPLALLIGSCDNNFKNIAEFSLTSAVIPEKSTKMAQDIYQSCLRETKYITDKLFPASVGIPEIEAQKKECSQNQKAAEEVNQVNSVLTDYMVALGKLASDDTVKFEKNLASLTASLKNLNTTLASVPSMNTTLASVPSSRGLKEEQIDAGLQIAGFIFNQLTTQFRQENLEEAILCTNQSIQEYTPGLVSIAKNFYADGILQSEGLTLDRYYRKYAPTPEQTTQLVALYTLEQDYLTAVNALDARKQAAKAYVEIIQATANTHQALFDEFNQSGMNAKELETFCQEYFTQDQEQSDQTSSLDLEQLQRVEQIVMEYTDEIKPQVEKLDRAF